MPTPTNTLASAGVERKVTVPRVSTVTKTTTRCLSQGLLARTDTAYLHIYRDLYGR